MTRFSRQTANRIRDALTLTEAECILNDAVTQACIEELARLPQGDLTELMEDYVHGRITELSGLTPTRQRIESDMWPTEEK